MTPQSPAAVEGEQHKVRVDGQRAVPDRGVLFGARIDAGVELSAGVLPAAGGSAIVLELLTYRPYQNGAHRERLHTAELTRITKPLTLAWFSDRGPYPTGRA